jgi:hypothetical protein
VWATQCSMSASTRCSRTRPAATSTGCCACRVWTVSVTQGSSWRR